MILTQTTGIIMGPVTKLLGFIFNAIYILFFGMGVKSIALSIVVFTVLVRLLLFPFNIKSTRSSKIQMYLKPEFNKITKKYKGKKDQESMLAQQQETRELQEKYGIKMTQGCLTSLIQFPVFIGLYNVIQNVPAYVPKVKELYSGIANQILLTENGNKLLTDFIADNKITRIAAKLAEFSPSTDIKSTEGITAINNIIDVLFKCNNTLLGKLADVFSANPEVANLINQNSADIERVNHFIFGINLSEAPGFKLSIALIIPIMSFICQLLAMLVTPMNETGDPQQDAQMRTMRKTLLLMPIMSFFVTVSAPAGLGIYWATSAFISFLITVFSNIYYNHIDMEALVEKQRKKAEISIAKRKASGKKSLSQKLAEAAAGQTGTEETSDSPANSKLNTYGRMNLKNFDYQSDSLSDEVSDDDSDTTTQSSTSKNSPKKGSLADKANAVKRFNDSGV